MDDPSAVNSQNALTSPENELTDSSTEESDCEDSTGSRPNDLTVKSSFKGRNGRVWVPRVPHHQELAHVILDTPPKD